MKPPLISLDQLRIVRAAHSLEADSLRVEFERGVCLVAYNDCLLNGARLTSSDASRSFPELSGLVVVSMQMSEEYLRLELTGGQTVDIGMGEDSIRGPEAYQLMIPGNPLLVEQNP